MNKIQLLVALVENDATVLEFDEVDTVRGIGIVNLSDEDDQSIQDELDTELQVLLDRGDILGWGSAETLFTMEGDTKPYTLAEMAQANVDEESGTDWITVELLAILPGETETVGAMQVTRVP